MPYIGVAPSSGLFKKLDSISVVNNQAAYTLQYDGSNYKPATASALLVSVNGVIQAAEDAYTISGSTITFTENLVTGDTIDFIIALGDVGNSVTPVDGSVTTAKLANDSVTEDKLANNLDMQNITLKGGTSNALTFDSGGRVFTPNRPVFRATHVGTTDYSTNGGIIIYNTSVINVGSCYSTTTGKFTAPVNGIYGFSYSYYTDATDSTMTDLLLNNTTSVGRTESRVSFGNNTIIATGLIIVEMDANDYVWIKNTESGGGTVTLIGDANTGLYNYFTGFLIG